MRLIDADRLIITMAEEMYSDKTFDEIMEEQPTVKAIPLDRVQQIRVEIEQTYNQEQEIDTKWAAGLKYSLKIIDKALKEQTT